MIANPAPAITIILERRFFDDRAACIDCTFEGALNVIEINVDVRTAGACHLPDHDHRVVDPRFAMHDRPIVVPYDA